MIRENSEASAEAMKSRRKLGSKYAVRYAMAAGMLVTATIFAGCGSSKTASADKETAPRAAVVQVTRQDLSNRLEIASEFLPYQEIDVYAKVSGYIQKLNIDWGTHIQKGQLMAVLEIPELEQQLEVDQAAVKRAEQDVARSQEELARAQSAYTVAHLTYTRLANVQKARPELVAQQEIDVAQGKDMEASAAVSGAKDALAGSEQALAAAKAGLARDQAVYSYSQITAPFTGIVTKLDAYTGALLPAGTSSNEGDQPLCRLSQNDLLRLVIPVPERAVPSIHLGETVEVEVSALKKTFSGKIVRTADAIDMATRTMHTEVQVPNPKFELVPGMYASVKIPIESAASALALPVQAVQSSGNGQGTVLVVNQSNRIEQRTVKLGLQTATEFEVLAGLQENDRVVFGEQSQYKPGELVTPAAVNAAAVE
jgi:RND family efflux transporter MFP subunit